MQLDLFEPRDFNFDYRVIVTYKAESAKSGVRFHHGRGSQEAIFGDAKNDAALDAIPTQRLIGNQLFTLCAMMAHNLSRELQMLASPAAERALPKRPAAWAFEKLDTLRHRLIQSAGRLTRPQGELTLTMSANEAVRQDLLHLHQAIRDAISSPTELEHLRHKGQAVLSAVAVQAVQNFSGSPNFDETPGAQS